MTTFNGNKAENSQTIEQTLLKRFGIQADKDLIAKLNKNETRLLVYNHLLNEINKGFSTGVYDSTIKEKQISLVVENTQKRVNVDSLYDIEQFKQGVIEAFPDKRLTSCVETLTEHLIVPNIILDEERTSITLQEAYKQINPVLTEVLDNEEIIRKNKKITELDLIKLEALTNSFKGQIKGDAPSKLLFSIIAYFIYTLTLIYSAYIVLKTYLEEQFQNIKYQILFLSFLLLNTLLAFAIRLFPSISFLVLPFSFSVISLALIFTPLGGILFSVTSYFIILPFLSWNILDSSTLFLTPLITLVIMMKMKDYNELVPLSVYLLISFLTISTITSLVSSLSLEDFGNNLVNGAISTTISITGIILLSPIIAKKLNMATKMILLELLDANSPLLKRMAVEAPGTFHHSVTVGVLAESAAEAIGANALLARVGSYYHDIGKIEAPQNYIENNSNANEFYNNKKPSESATIIKNHVLEGTGLAKKYNLPQQVIDIIAQHHGDSKVLYFYNKAKENNEEIEDESVFRYIGPKPQTKEAALVMIADVVESTAKVLMHQHTEESLEKIINDTISRLIAEDQLSDAPITLKELNTVKSYMLPIILGIYRKRIEYPENKSKEQN